MRIYHISDTHGFHDQMDIPEEVDVLVHTGDSTNYRDPLYNEKEFYDFINWYAQIFINDKIYIAGNHDSFIFHNEKLAIKEFQDRGIIYLNKSEVTIDGVKFYGDPISPEFGYWCFMAKREKMNKHWQLIPDDVNVLLTHTPPKGFLDMTENRNREIELCGCSALKKRIENLKDLKVNCFGHIHNFKDLVNTGTRISKDVIYSNAASVTDAKFDLGITHQGNFIEI